MNNQSSIVRTFVLRLRAGLKLSLLLAPIAAHSATLIVQDFSSSPAWPSYPYKYGSGSTGITGPSLAVGAFGTIDTYNSTTPSAGLRLTANSSASGTDWEVGATSGFIVPNRSGVPISEFDPTKITISFDCYVNYSRPVLVALESYSSPDLSARTGRSQMYVYPAAAAFYQRKTFELSDSTASNGTPFLPNSPYYRILFIIDSKEARGWPKSPSLELRVDNVNISTPAYYVDSVKGRDWNSGLSEAQAFQTARYALSQANTGDIILVRKPAKKLPTDTAAQYADYANYRNYSFYKSGTKEIDYTAKDATVSFSHSGTPSKWIVLKNYPGERPIFESSGYQCVSVGGEAAGTQASYIEVRGFELVGVAQQLDLADPGTTNNSIKGTSAPGANGSGVAVRGNVMAIKPHHIRVADNIVHDLGGGGIIALSADWLFVENNLIYNTSWWTNSASSAISYLSAYDFPGTSGEYRMLISGNEVFNNECRMKWQTDDPFYSDGNGIIIDTFRNSASSAKISYPAYRGRTLVENNLSYNNGGSGIHSFHSDQIDIIHNSAYFNSRRSAYQGSYGEIYAIGSNDIKIYNNILVAADGENLNNCSYSTPYDNPPPQTNSNRNPRTTGVIFRNNVYKYSDTDVNGGGYGGQTQLYPVNAAVTAPYDTKGKVLQKNENDDATLAENNIRTYATIWNGAVTGDFTLRPDSPARQRGTLIIGKGNTGELPFLPSLDINFNLRVQGTLAAPTANIPDAGAFESPATE